MSDLFLVTLTLIEPEDLETILKDKYKPTMTGFYTVFVDEKNNEFELIITLNPVIDEIVNGIVSSINKLIKQ